MTTLRRAFALMVILDLIARHHLLTHVWTVALMVTVSTTELSLNVNASPAGPGTLAISQPILVLLAKMENALQSLELLFARVILDGWELTVILKSLIVSANTGAVFGFTRTTRRNVVAIMDGPEKHVQ